MRRTIPALILLALTSCAGAPSDVVEAPALPHETDPDPWLAWHMAEQGIASTSQALTTCPAGQTLFTATATGDAQVVESAPTTTYPSNTAAGVGGLAPGRRKFFAGFSFAALPVGAVVNSAELTVTQNPLASSPAGTLDLLTATGAWTEASITWATQPGATYLASASTTGAVGTVSTFTIPAATITSLITGPNNGFVVDKQASVQGNLGTRENTTATARPALTLCYTPPASPCTNGVKDGAETDVDCGGGTCSPCVDGLACVIATDCAHNACGPASTCIASPTCTPSTVALPTAIDAQYGATSVESLSLYLPTGTPPAGGWPIVIDVHGGGFTSTGGGRNSSAITFHAQVLNAAGIALGTVDYLLTTSTTNAFPTAVNDLRSVACWLSANGATYNVNPLRAGWIGYSAGGGLVGVFATTIGATTLPGGTVLATPTCSLAGAVKAWGAEYGNVGMVPGEWSASNPNEWWYAASTPVGGTLPPGFLLDATVTCGAGGPPVYLNDGSGDTTVSPAAIRRLAAQCRSAGVPTFDLVVPSGVHGYGPVQWSPAMYQPASCEMYKTPAGNGLAESL